VFVRGSAAVAECPYCRYRWRNFEVQEFGRRQWETERSARLLLGCLRAVGQLPDERKGRLLYAAVARIGFDWCHNVWFREAVAASERWADTGVPPPGVDDVHRQLNRFNPRWNTVDSDWRRVGMAAIAASPDLAWVNLRQPTQEFFADAYHDLIPNPFLTVDWKPEWKTSTVLELARTTYDRHAFDVLPILADALLDAGCDHHLVQEHCRSGRPHARGCWVLDALLGLS
jgi:hypothetical protein